jgi:hypothetical protein
MDPQKRTNQIFYVAQVKSLPEFGDGGRNHAKVGPILRSALGRVGAQVSDIWNVTGDDFDMLILGTADSSDTLLKIAAICKGQGYQTKVHLAVPNTQYLEIFDTVRQVFETSRPEPARST